MTAVFVFNDMLGFWTVLADSGVSTKHLVVLLYQLIKNGQEVQIFYLLNNQYEAMILVM